MRRLLREPLLHFLLLGAVLFIAFSLKTNSGGRGELRDIAITQGQVESLVEGFTRTRQRLPTAEELQGLIRERVREEVYYREALALGLDKDDLIIRRRLAQKMQFISDDSIAQVQPRDVELNAYLQAHPDKFRVQPQVTFRQLYVNPQKHGANLTRDAAQLLAKMNSPAGDTGFAVMGDPLMLDHQFNALPMSEVGRLFGEQFAVKLGGLAPGRWQGPIESAFGEHLVYISERKEGRAPALAEVHDDVRREWDDDRRLQANDQFYQKLLAHYTVTIEALPPGAAAKRMAAAK